jgi:Fe-S-cluster-containing dehydrogenase component/anaerobic selenocysteine-containing dehydrogenase
MSLVDRSTPLTVNPERAGRVERHSPGESAAVNGDPDFITTRRSFLKAAGFTFAGAVATSCGGGRAVGALPYVAQPEGLVPGRPMLYASTCAACEAGCGVLVTNRDGRPVKIEGNPDHPFSGGSTCAVGQASILGLYDSLRLAYPTRRGERSTWDDVDKEISAALDRLRQDGGAVRILTTTITSPTTSALIADFIAGFRNARHVSYDPISASAALEAHSLTHGARLVPHYRFDRADVIVSLDADFLGTWMSPVEFTRGYTSRRRIDERAPANRVEMSYHVQIESRLSLTGSNADRRLRVAPGEIGHVATHLAARLARRAGLPFAPDGLTPSRFESALEAVAGRLWDTRGRGLVISASQDVRVQLLCNFINHAIGAYGATLDLERPSYQRQGSDKDLAELRAELARGEVQALLVAGANPVYDLPDAGTLANDLRRVPLLVSTAERVDETAALAQFVCPAHHYLESWNDAEPVSGVVSLTQPAIQPLHETRALIESLSAWTKGAVQPALELVRGHWEKAVYPRTGRAATSVAGEPFDAFWNRTLERGVAEIEPRPVTARPFSASAVRAIVRPEDELPADALALVLYPKIGMLDGRHGHNAWLHELPDPVTKVTWDNYACFSPAAATRLGIEDGDIVRVAAAGGPLSIELPAFVQPGQHDSSVAVALGYGRLGTDRFARVGPPWFEARARDGVVGVNASALIGAVDATRLYSGRAVMVVKTGRARQLASTQTHHSLAAPATLATRAGSESRPVVQEVTLAALTGSTAPVARHESEGDLWPPDHQYAGHRWGMAVDLNACTGCSACVIACQSENNVPVVGQDEVRRNREMHWIRIDRYYSGSDEEPDVAHQPMMCQHCEQAPCETVCPVLATTHSEEGLNEQVYNRCVGTRYCANNCPYKVRRFNWFDYPHEDRLQNLVFNPNVTVRSRGVMEKCTFCVQRIEESRIEARRLGQPLADGAIKTACQQVCPADAIVFGDLNDPKSRASVLNESRRAYRVLEELNTRPAVRYLKLVRHDA